MSALHIALYHMCFGALPPRMATAAPTRRRYHQRSVSQRHAVQVGCILDGSASSMSISWRFTDVNDEK
eukprot:3626433-Prymnesium_polylepis.1